jgi:hypothetical protein
VLWSGSGFASSTLANDAHDKPNTHEHGDGKHDHKRLSHVARAFWRRHHAVASEPKKMGGNHVTARQRSTAPTAED